MKTELVKIGDPYNGDRMVRSSYYVRTRFALGNKSIKVAMKLDTGAGYTVIGLDYPGLEKYRDEILASTVNGSARDASGRTLELKGYVVQNFKITEDIVIPEILLFFSEKMENRAVLGMDILSLFDFQYLREKGYNWGTFWINNPEDVLRTIMENKKKQNLEYINPGTILEIDEPSTLESLDRMQGLS